MNRKKGQEQYHAISLFQQSIQVSLFAQYGSVVIDSDPDGKWNMFIR